MQLSIIIPVLNELANLQRLLPLLRTYYPETEIVLIDGGSTDGSWDFISQQTGVIAAQSARGRARQLNAGAALASGHYYFFLHADTLPPPALCQHLQESIEAGYAAACCRLRFDSRSRFLAMLGWFTRFPWNGFRFGDQGLFVEAALFHRLGGYKEERLLLEDNDLVVRIRQVSAFRVLPVSVVTSARKYQQHGALYLQSLYILLYGLDRLGASQQLLLRIYRRWLSSSL